ncbi:MAG: prepilin peptidase [Candidatus Baltobacteraceae bacterium]
MPYISAHHMQAAFVLVVAAAAAGAVFDVRTRRIPNALAAGLFAAGLAVNALAGMHFAALDLLIAAGVLLAGTAAFSLKLIGGGDVKLLAAAAGTLAYPAGIVFILFTFLSGGAIAVLVALARGTARATFANVRGIALPLLAGVQPARLQGGTSMPYALAICAGAVIAFATNGLVPHLRF